METRKIFNIDLEGKDGNENDGGINSHTFAKDGETSYSRQPPTWIFASSLHIERQLQIC
jgi:hypothetical protein